MSTSSDPVFKENPRMHAGVDPNFSCDRSSDLAFKYSRSRLDKLGDKMKKVEEGSDRKLDPGSFAIARLDGCKFSKITRCLQKPYDKRLAEIMINVTTRLIIHFNASFGYTQSDEISLIFTPARVPFSGRKQKIASLFASQATVFINQEILAKLPELATKNVTFDCRVFGASDFSFIRDYLLWRELDAYRNAVFGALQSVDPKPSPKTTTFQHLKTIKEIAGKDFGEMYPTHFKFGVVVKRVKIESTFNPDEIETLPPLHKARSMPNHVFIRTKICVIEQLSPLANLEPCSMEDELIN